MVSAREILETRKAALNAELKPLLEKRDQLFITLIETDERIGAAKKELEGIERAIQSLAEYEAKTSRIPIMQAILEVLKNKPQGMTAKEILSELNEKYYGGELVRHSLSPQLSRLKDRDKKIEYRNGRWIRLPDQPSLFINRRV